MPVNVTIKLFATLRKDRFDSENREYPEGTALGQIIDRLAIPREQVSIIFVNNRHAGFDYLIKDGDTAAFFPPIGGG